MELQKLIDGLKAHKSGAASYESVDEAIRVFEAMRDVDGEKVCKGLEVHIKPNSRCVGCPYPNNGLCGDQLYSDVLALIRQQQERIAELEAAQTARLITEKDFEKADCWGNIPAWYEHNPSIKIKTIDGWGIIKPENLRDRMTRYWTQRPTDEQRKAVKWDG